MDHQYNLIIVRHAIEQLTRAERLMTDREIEDNLNLPASGGDDEPDAHVTRALNVLESYHYAK